MIIRSLISDATGETDWHPYVLEECFPHIVRRMIALWRKPEMEVFLDGLLAPASEGAIGFPENALVEIRSIKAICFPAKPPQEQKQEKLPPVRDRLLRFLDVHDMSYPDILDAEHPDLLQSIVSLLEQPELDDFLNNLLTPAQQIKHRFSELAMLEIMTIIAACRASYFPSSKTVKSKANTGATKASSILSEELHPEDKANPHISEEDLASHVFDRIHRW